MLNLLRIIWASPGSLVGLIVGVVSLCLRGRAQRVGRTLEFHGPLIVWIFDRLPVKPMAMTLGHTVLGRSEAALDVSRDHEFVHVRQYERWGPFFIPAYLLCSLVILIRGGDAYRDNPFEREAYDSEPRR